MPLKAPFKGFPQKGEWMELPPSCLWPGRTGTRQSWISGHAARWAQINRRTTPEALSTLASARSQVERWRARVPSPFTDFHVSEHCQGSGDSS